MADDEKITVTIKAGGDYAAPWIVIRGDTGAEIKDTIIDMLGGLKHPDPDVTKNLDVATLVTSAAMIVQERYDEACKEFVNNVTGDNGGKPSQNTDEEDRAYLAQEIKEAIDNADNRKQLGAVLRKYRDTIVSDDTISKHFRERRENLKN